MTPSARFTTTTIVLVTLVLGVLLAATALLALLLMRYPARAAVEPLFSSDAEMLITPVPTVEHSSSLIAFPLPTITSQVASRTGLGLQAASDFSPIVPLTIPDPLVDPNLSLFVGPVDVPLEIRIPTLKIKAPVLGVGLALTNAMATPIGILPNDPIWQTVFWYRGGGTPGDVGTATFSGHFDDADGRPAVFAFLGNLRIGDLIIVQDKRNGLDIPFIVTETTTYTEEEATDPEVLSRIFGSSSVSGAESQPVSDQLSHLTLITCAGAWVNGSFNRRLVVYAIRASYPPALGT
jgi:hypothetical protein